ncbi:Protein transport protein Sec61 subunit beta [Gaertneriomyces sp. JEL0708]|nr:Protein transport protein Sec61 subunit beta [Gaertneriomyces sp. JEL0708]
MSDTASPSAPPRTASGLRRRQAGSVSRNSGASRPSGASGPGGMMRIYTDDSPGIKVDPVVVLIGSLVFIASVFVLHIVGKYTR